MSGTESKAQALTPIERWYMLYLNDLDGEGGETEFLYQKMRVKPEENLMLVWPASYTHAHRGNPVLGETHKYIVTGWFYYD